MKEFIDRLPNQHRPTTGTIEEDCYLSKYAVTVEALLAHKTHETGRVTLLNAIKKAAKDFNDFIDQKCGPEVQAKFAKAVAYLYMAGKGFRMDAADLAAVREKYASAIAVLNTPVVEETPPLKFVLPPHVGGARYMAAGGEVSPQMAIVAMLPFVLTAAALELPALLYVMHVPASAAVLP